MTLTKKLKQTWIEALESGDYVQQQGNYTDKPNLRGYVTQKDLKQAKRHCCLAVLDCIAPSYKVISNWTDIIGSGNVGKLIALNDKFSKNFKPDYSNVLPFIKAIKLQ